MANADNLSPYRWVIEILLFLAISSQTLTWLAPSPILGPIMASLNISLAVAGLVISIIALCIALFSLLGVAVMARLGAYGAMLAGFWLMSAAEVASGYSTGLAGLLACRVVEGIGSGVMVAPPGTLVMEWFGEREWPYINMVNAACGYVALAVVYGITARVFVAAGSSWQRVFRYYGLGCAGIALLWTVFGRERKLGRAQAGADPFGRSHFSLGEVARMRGVILIAVSLFGGMWVYQLYAAFLPEYFRVYRALGLTGSSSLTAIFPLTGMFAAVAGGLGTGLAGRRRPFTWPLALLALIACIGVVLASSLTLIRASLVVAGIGAAGPLAALLTIVMELPGMTPEKVGSALAVVWASAYAGAFVAPFLGGAFASVVGLKATLLGFLAFQALSVVMLYLLPETGRGRADARARAAS